MLQGYDFSDGCFEIEGSGVGGVVGVALGCGVKLVGSEGGQLLVLICDYFELFLEGLVLFLQLSDVVHLHADELFVGGYDLLDQGGAGLWLGFVWGRFGLGCLHVLGGLVLHHAAFIIY